MTTPPIDGPGFNGGVYGGDYRRWLWRHWLSRRCGRQLRDRRATVRWYGRAEYLLWWTKDMPNSTPLVTSVAPGTPTGGTPIPGAVGGAGTTVIMGGNDDDLGVRQGGRFTLGRWFDPQQTVAFEGNYFFLGSASDSQSAIALGGPGCSDSDAAVLRRHRSFDGRHARPKRLLPALATSSMFPAD